MNLRETAKIINKGHLEARGRIIEKADAALHGMHILPGTMNKPQFAGSPVQWNESPVGDKEYLWTLNRMYHWRDLGKAALLTGDRRYANKIKEEWLSWIESCPAPSVSEETLDILHGVHPWRALEIGIRHYASWPFAFAVLSAEKILTKGEIERIKYSIHEHGYYLFTWSPLLWPRADHNHFLSEMLGLLCLSANFPDLPTSKTWSEAAMHHIERCMQNQITAEGGQVEGCPHYHFVCLELFSLAIKAAQKCGLSFSQVFRQSYDASIDYALHVTRPTGTAVPFGDSDSVPRPLIDAGMAIYGATGNRKLLRLAATLLGYPDLISKCAEEAWSVPSFASLRNELSIREESSTSTLRWFRALDQAAVRSGWSSEALSVFFSCRSPTKNGHAHIDLNSFDLCALGKALLIDPGRFTYRQNEDRYEFKRAANHNTLLIDDKDHYEYKNGSHFGAQRKGHILNVQVTDRFTCITGEHENYAPCLHRRTLYILRDKAVIVYDEVFGLAPRQTVQLYFHVDSTSLIVHESISTACTTDPQANIAITFCPSLTIGLLPGRISEEIDVVRSSTRLRLSDSGGNSHRTYTTALVPFKGSRRPEITLHTGEREPSVVIVDGETCEIGRF